MKLREQANQLYKKAYFKYLAAKSVLTDKRGESSVGQAVAILIAVVIGALLLAGLYKLFSETILPTLTQKIREMFDYNG